MSHLYNLRQQARYRERRLHYVKTRPTTVAIGERRRPDPEGQPGYLRVDTVHQGDSRSAKGVYHIDAVDEITQWQIVAATARISEAWLEPVLAAMLRQFPFRIRGFHSDNGSEFINQTVARLLNKLLIEQTKSRPRHSNDNGLVETKNGAVINKHLGYGYIDAAHAERLQQFYSAHFNPEDRSRRAVGAQGRGQGGEVELQREPAGGEPERADRERDGVGGQRAGRARHGAGHAGAGSGHAAADRGRGQGL